jgi:CheY-like chemotaxis protein
MKILIVDNDESTVVTLKSLILSREKMDIDAAYSGRECLDKMMLSPDYDAVLLDIMMPQVSGMDVCREMAKNERLRSIPVLLMSSALPVSPGEYLSSLAKSNELYVVKGVLEKPFVLDDLLAKIHEVARKG